MDKQTIRTIKIIIFFISILLLVASQTTFLQEESYKLVRNVVETSGLAMFGYSIIDWLWVLPNMFIEIKRDKSLKKLLSGSIVKLEKKSSMPLLLVSDVEGCITPHDRTEIDISNFAKLRRYCEFANMHKEYPQLIFFTGRSQGYVELLAQLLGLLDSESDVPFVIENGAALYYPRLKKTEMLITTAQLAKINSIRKQLGEECPNNEFEPKSFMVTLNPAQDETIEGLRNKIAATLQRLNLFDQVQLTSTASSVDISPLGVSKLAGVQALLQKKFAKHGELITLDRIIAFGDQFADLEVLKAASRSYCPAGYSGDDVIKTVREKFGDKNIIRHRDIDFVISVIEDECGLKIS